ncbi:phosphoinositide phosphatase SAC8-like [Primulina huaijiensis]|uniref:phosphoinositide phosphatase SAC8-like n=1 Tax=Primulina huaijiensis TaxID=1492673 RepID=UPI003CC71A54
MEAHNRSNSASAGHFKLWSELELREFADKFLIKSVESPDQGFSFSRSDGSIDKLQGEITSPCFNVGDRSLFRGVNLVDERYACSSYHFKEGNGNSSSGFLFSWLHRCSSYRANGANEASRFLTSQEKSDEDYVMTLLKIVEATRGLYYSYETDITLKYFLLSFGEILKKKVYALAYHTANGIYQLAEENKSIVVEISSKLQGDPSFVWNWNVIEELIENKVRISLSLVLDK